MALEVAPAPSGTFAAVYAANVDLAPAGAPSATLAATTTTALNLCDRLPMYPEASPSSEGGSLVWLFA